MGDTADNHISVPDQQKLWDEQHKVRGRNGLEGTQLINTPNESAVAFESILPPQSVIF